MDITRLRGGRLYIPIARGFVYLAVVLDWFSRRVLAWRLSITIQASFCIEALEEALGRYGKPEMVNTDQGSQFTGEAFTGRWPATALPSAWTARAPVRRAAMAQRQIRGGVSARL